MIDIVKSDYSAVQADPKIPFYDVRLEGVKIRSKEDLLEVTELLTQKAPSSDAAMGIKRGVIDRSAFPFEELSIVDPFEASAKFHRHETYEITLISDGESSVPTLISSRAAVLAALQEMFADSSGIEALNDMTQNHIPVQIEQMKNLFDSDAQPDVKFDTFQVLAKVKPGEHLYPFFSEIQRRITELAAVQWDAYEFCLVGKKCVHARDIREKNTRDNIGQLRYFIPKRGQAKPQNEVSLR